MNVLNVEALYEVLLLLLRISTLVKSPFGTSVVGSAHTVVVETPSSKGIILVPKATV